ncbi:SMP-30/gluconolactonase/LRE family protein [Marmoricola sp. RAF53]|uniref:SMP-30/gluconolactonase/LRE family protein n=1 Tax=Marmoricola sp. RAF53 TaxID=3233059 RepID=UPI003F9C3C76
MDAAVLATGFGLVESPRWHDGRLWFADWSAGEVRVLSDDGPEATSEVVVRHASLPLCFDFLPDGTLLVVSAAERALLRAGPDGTLTRYADLAALAPYGCNDIVVDGRGHAYVNSPGFDFATGPPPGPTAPGTVLLVTPDGTARQVADDLSFPNGMAVTADGRTLVVAESYGCRLTAFDVADDGTLGDRRTFADLGEDPPDGICLDADGAAWYADVPHQHCVRVAEGGEILDVVPLDRGAFACMLGGAGGRTLFAVGARWPGAERLGDPAWEWDGFVVAAPAPARRAGWPGGSAP